ncbi:MAG: peroxidase [Armatimonadetes bacterium]|nr:peroxidase [Armatimonadota bacterium]
MRDFRSAPISDADKAMLAYAEKLTLAPSEMREEDVQVLRAHGFSDRAILDMNLVAGIYNVLDRLVDGLGGELHEWMHSEAERLGIAGWKPGSPAG